MQLAARYAPTFCVEIRGLRFLAGERVAGGVGGEDRGRAAGGDGPGGGNGALAERAGEYFRKGLPLLLFFECFCSHYLLLHIIIL